MRCAIIETTDCPENKEFSKIALQCGEGPGAETDRERLIEPEADASSGRAPQRPVGVASHCRGQGFESPAQIDVIS